MTYELTAPFASIKFRNKPKHWKLLTAGWMAFWAAIITTIAYAYMFIIPSAIGFEKTVLLGFILITLAVSNQ